MEENRYVDVPVLLLDNFNEDSFMLYESMRKSGFKGLVLTLGDDGYLPEDVYSIYTCFLGNKDCGRPRYFDEIAVPDYWEIKSSNTSGQIFDLNKERGKIFYQKPTNKRQVKVVDWYDENHVCRLSEHYNNKGNIYARTIFNKKSQLVSRTYFDVLENEIVVENYVTHDITVNYMDKVFNFHDKVSFILFVFDVLGIKPKRLYYNSLGIPFMVSEALDENVKQDVLFWQEGYRDDIPGNMQFILDDHSKRTNEIVVQKKESYEKLIELGVNKDMVHTLGYVYDFKRENQHSNRVLICTNSDHIERLQEIIYAAPDMEYHICALTEMSSKLMDFNRFSNVTLYPACKSKDIEQLFDSCDYYLDINHEGEIVDAVKEAFLHNMLILGFKEVAHNVRYTLNEFLFQSNEYMDLVKILLDSTKLDLYLSKQRTKAMSQSIIDYQIY